MTAAAPVGTADDMADRLVELRDILAGLTLPLPLPGCTEALQTRAELVDQIEDYLLPRLANLDAPLLAVLGGSTGAGKSTLTNSLVGAEVSKAGVLRPTTRAPVLVHHPTDGPWFSGDGVLPELPRRTGAQASGHVLHLVSSAAMQPGLGLLDAPDIDSVEETNHELAAQLLGAADLWLFVTTAARYADAVPWRYLARASERAAAIALIVNRIPPTPDGSAQAAIAADVRRMLDDAGLAGARLFAIEESPLAEGLLDGPQAEVRAWLDELVADSDARRAVVRATLDGAIASLAVRGQRVAEAVDDHIAAIDALTEVAQEQARTGVRAVQSQLRSGVLLRGEVLDRFRETVGTGEWMDRLQRTVGRMRDKVSAALTGEAPQVDAAKGQLRRNLVSLIDDALARAREDTIEAWRLLPGGREVLLGGTVAPITEEDVEQAIARWQDDVLATVRATAGGKVAMARGVSLGVNGIGVTLMMAIFASTGGLTGGELATAGGTAAISQALLTAVLGEQAVRDLSRSANEDLLRRVGALADLQRERLLALTDGLPTTEQAQALAAAQQAVAR